MEDRPLSEKTIYVGSPSDLHFDDRGALRNTHGRIVGTRPLTSGRVAALHSARTITSEEAARLAMSSLDLPPKMPRWLVFAFALLLGFILGEGRLSCLAESAYEKMCS